MEAAINTRPPRRVHAERRTIDGGALAADGRCDGGMAADRRGGAMADWRGGGSTARVLTVVKLLALFWICLTSSGRTQTWHLPQRAHALSEHLIQEDLNHAHVCCVRPCAIGRRRAPGWALTSP